MTTTRRPPPWRDIRVLTWAFQLVVVGAVVALVLWLRDNLESRNFELDYGYLDRPFNSPFPGDANFRESQPVSDAVWGGIRNTGRLIVAGIVLATLLGTLLGVARLSQNFLVRTAARWYVEVIRNVPLVAIFIIAYSGIALALLPSLQEPLDLAPVFVANVRGVGLPWYTADTWTWDLGFATWRVTANWKFVLTLIAIGAAVIAVRRWRRAVGDRIGGSGRVFWFTLATVAAVAVLAVFVFGFDVTTPRFAGKNPRQGMIIQAPFFSAMFALVIYTSSHIAEIVRGSIQAVSKGQSEAASALALSGAQRLRYVVLPQAMRIALPPMGNQYLNLAKNSSLAALVTFPEITKITQLGIVASSMPRVAPLIMLLGIYLVISLITSSVVNLLNRRLAIVER